MPPAPDRPAKALARFHREKRRRRGTGTALALLTALGGCAAQTVPPSGEGAMREVAVVHPGDAAVSVVGTPFLLVFKSVICAATVVVAAPASALAAMSESRFGPEIRSSLSDGVAQNCGPPYVLSPYRVVRVEPDAGLQPELAPDLKPGVGLVPEPRLEHDVEPLPGAPVPLVPE